MNENEVVSFLNDIAPENQDFTDGNENVLDAPIQEEQVVEEPKEEKPLPFHKDPKVMRFIEKELEKRIPKVIEQKANLTGDVEDDYWTRLIGNDTPEKVAMVREAKAREERLLQQAEERAFGRLSTERQRELEAERQAKEKLDSALEDIEDAYGTDLTSSTPVARKNRVDFMNFVEKLAPKDAEGNIADFPDMKAAYEAFQATRKTSQPSVRAKDIAARSMTRSGEGTQPQERVTFDNMDSVLERLFKKS